jgi:hypothetical protein
MYMIGCDGIYFVNVIKIKDENKIRVNKVNDGFRKENTGHQIMP